MVDIVFYEKPGCVNGEKQKAILRAAGHRLTCRDILTYPWNRDKLLGFVVDKEPVEMMNHTAPAIKNEEIIPDHLSFDEALMMMLMEPILIKRPLVEVDGMKIQGFMDPLLDPYKGDWDGKEDVTTCPNLHTLSCDEQRDRT